MTYWHIIEKHRYLNIYLLVTLYIRVQYYHRSLNMGQCHTLQFNIAWRLLIHFFDIASLMQGDQVTKGVLSFDSHLTSLVQEGKIDNETAMEFATSRTDMKLRLSGLL